jgi:hypothetical protein
MVEIKTGDIIAFSGFGHKSVIVNLVTFGWPFWWASHVGIIGEYKGEQLLFESTTLSNIPCAIQRCSVKGVQAVRLEERLGSYQGRVYQYPIYRPLFGFEADRLNAFLLGKIGTPYDLHGGMRSATHGLSWLEARFKGEDLNFIFCSELVAAAHAQIGLLQTSSASRWNPNRLIRYGRRTGILKRARRLRCEDFC